MRYTRLSSLLMLPFLLALPTSTNYEMHDFGLGGGGSGITDSSNYSINSIVGEVSSENLSGTTYDLGPGLSYTRQSNVPAAPTFSNPANHYNKLQFTLNTGSNPTDTLFAIAISADSFSTTSYVQADNTVGATPVYQTNATWGSGTFIVGLTPGTTYSLKVKAIQTRHTESAYSAVATASTVTPSLTYDLDVSSTDSESGAPYIVSMGTLSVGSVTTASERVWIDLATNAEQGAYVYVYANGAGLQSANAAYTITSTSGDLGPLSEGFGLRSASAAQSSGGPLAAVSPYNGSNDVVGIIDTSSRAIFSSTNAPIVAGRGSLYVKAKASTTTPASGDYAATLTMVASATF